MRPAHLLVCTALLLAACQGGAPSVSSSDPSPTPSASASPASPTRQAAGAARLQLENMDGTGDCAGIVPVSAPAPVTVQRSAPGGGACLGGTSDGTGAVALAARGPDGGLSWQLYSGDGEARRAVAADALVPEPVGFDTIAADASAALRLVSVAPDGTASPGAVVSPDPAQWTDFRRELAGDPRGGAFALVRAVAVAGNHWHVVSGRRFDAAGSPTAPDASPIDTGSDPSAPWFMGAGVSTAGEALALYQDSAFVDAAWLDPSGAIVAQARDQEPSAGVVGDGLLHDVEIAPLLDGSVAVRSDGTFRRRYERLATASSPLPDWLGARSGWTLRLTRGAAGYAALEPAGLASCAQRIDLLSPSGRLCGRITLSEDGTACTTGALDQGWDGTLIQQSAVDPCTARWWPRLLAR